LLLGCGKCNTRHTPITPRATPAATGKREPDRATNSTNKKSGKVKDRFLLVKKEVI
jgi:hypothetical protein